MIMPIEIFDTKMFINLSQNAIECRVKRLKDIVKLKLKTNHRLYTIKLDEKTADQILKELKCKVIEL
jgi:hypothetical protein